MKITKILSNNDIYYIATGLNSNFDRDLKLPIKVSFYLNKNKKYFTELAQQIEEEKNKLCAKFGTFDSVNNRFHFENDEILKQVNKEFSELMGLKQEVSFYEIPLEDFGEINLSIKEMDILEYMIKEE